ncbi:MFS transporter [Marinoscillum sp. MHG1-6]|uniref:MFS transporter n=1 Tax=Marinoscillum sp. MHG1-6 TaxID=2959627 RepID=UPI0021576486|nr:MFS transporter [Marinoscillum sp. MHG1-6]
MLKAYSRQFWLLSFSSFLFFGSFNMVLPELPDFMRKMGGEDFIGLHITFFTLTALISRPFSGKLTDTWGRIPVMVFGAAVTAVVSFFYPFFLNIYIFLAIRFLHGFSTGFKPTGTAAYVADIVPLNRRGEGMGILSLFGMTGMGIGNYVGGAIANNFSIEVLFYSSGLVALFSVAVLAGMKETVENKQKFSPGLLKLNRSEIFEPAVVVPSVVMMLVTFSFGASLTLAPDLSTFHGIENKGLFFSYFTFTSLISRLFGGRFSDLFGRRKVTIAAMLIVGIGSTYIGFALNAFHFLVGALIFGAGYGLSSPALFAWAADLSPIQNRGRGFSTLFMALEIGIGMGAMLAGQIYAGQSENFSIVFGGCGALAIIAMVYLIFNKTD